MFKREMLGFRSIQGNADASRAGKHFPNAESTGVQSRQFMYALVGRFENRGENRLRVLQHQLARLGRNRNMLLFAGGCEAIILLFQKPNL